MSIYSGLIVVLHYMLYSNLIKKRDVKFVYSLSLFFIITLLVNCIILQNNTNSKKVVVNVASKISKNNSENKKGTQKSIVVSSLECEKCLDKCDEGIQYMKSIIGKFGKGITCHKLKGK
jgi:uncharacterized sodium:solute symporter family permease YidK